MSERRKHLEFLRKTAKEAIWAGDYERALFYAQTALAKSRDLGLEELTGTSLNLLASLELHESRFEAARDLFQEAVERLESQGESLSRQAAVATDNLGYCHIALDRCFAHVKLSRLDEAESWGIRALGLGKEFGREDVIKNSHYLLAETYAEMGHENEADEQYEALSTYYPDFPALKHYLRQISLMEVIN